MIPSGYTHPTAVVETAPPAATPIPEPPKWLTDEAQARFVEVARQLASVGALEATDQGVLARYCAVWARYCAAEREMAETGEGVHYSRLTDRNGLPASSVASPAMLQASKCHDQLVKLEAELGLTPRSRRLQKREPVVELDNDPMAEFFGPIRN